MSVINKALKELNKRNSGDEYGKYVPPEKAGMSFNKLALASLVIIGVAVLAGSGYYAYKIGEKNNLSKTKLTATLSKEVESSSEKTASVAEVSTDPNLNNVQITNERNTVSQNENEVTDTQNNVIASVETGITAVNTESVNSEHALDQDVPVLDVHQKTERNLIRNRPENHEVAQSQVKTVEKQEIHKVVKTDSQSAKESKKNNVVEDYVYDADNYVIEEEPNVVVVEKPVSRKASSLKVAKSQLTPNEQKEIYRTQALNSLGKGDSRRAIDAYRNILAVDPKDIEAREKLASLYFGQDNYVDAIRVLDGGIAQTPYHYDYRLFLARIYKSRGDDAKALKVLETVTPPVAGNIDYYATMASIARESGNFPVAAKAYRALASTNSPDGKWYLGLGIAEEKQGKHKQALEAYKKASSLYLSQSSRKFVEGRIKFLETLR